MPCALGFGVSRVRVGLGFRGLGGAGVVGFQVRGLGFLSFGMHAPKGPSTQILRLQVPKTKP